ncbi:7-cyano-7-deazaguanine synthase QueC [bacterium]|nr:7-cyano-7-deazaguanine synthase QueC [bacterium]
MKAIILLSGGLDSTTTLAVAIDRGFEILPLHLNYRHRAEKKELEAFDAILNHYGIERRLVVELPFFSRFEKRGLVNPELDLSAESYNDSRLSYLPFRNGVMLAIATAVAEEEEAEAIFTGVMEEDSSGYPDCREKFIQDFQKAISSGTKKGNITVITPIIHMKKSEVVLLGKRLGVPFHLTWSCYEGGESPCGRCASCLLRRSAFEEAGVNDPLI